MNIFNLMFQEMPKNMILASVTTVLARIVKMAISQNQLNPCKCYNENLNNIPLACLCTFFTKGIVQPHFQYCCSVQDCPGSTEINQLQKLPNRNARILRNSSFHAQSSPLIESLGWKTIHGLIPNGSQTVVSKIPTWVGSAIGV